METKKFNKKCWKPIRDRKPSKRQGTFFFFWLAILPFDSDITPLGDFEKKQGDEGMEPGGNPSHGFPIVMFCSGCWWVAYWFSLSLA